jgi:hypothetical protein
MLPPIKRNKQKAMDHNRDEKEGPKQKPGVIRETKIGTQLLSSP